MSDTTSASTVKCLLSYKKLKIADLPIFAQGVKDGVYNNDSVFLTPPITEVNFQKLIDEYIAKRGSYVNGGSAQEPAWNVARQQLIDGLDTTANYVNIVAAGDENIIILAGYVPSKSTSTSVPKPSKITGVEMVRSDVSGSISAYCKKQTGVNTYICVLTEGAPLPEGFTVSAAGQLVYTNVEGASALATVVAASSLSAVYVDLNQSRYKEFQDLAPLKTYYCKFIGINAGGVGPMSNATSIVCV